MTPTTTHSTTTTAHPPARTARLRAPAAGYRYIAHHAYWRATWRAGAARHMRARCRRRADACSAPSRATTFTTRRTHFLSRAFALRAHDNATTALAVRCAFARTRAAFVRVAAAPFSPGLIAYLRLLLHPCNRRCRPHSPPHLSPYLPRSSARHLHHLPGACLWMHLHYPIYLPAFTAYTLRGSFSAFAWRQAYLHLPWFWPTSAYHGCGRRLGVVTFYT